MSAMGSSSAEPKNAMILRSGRRVFQKAPARRIQKNKPYPLTTQLGGAAINQIIQYAGSHAHPRPPVPFKPFPFMQLPPEIRNLIYELSISTDGINQYFEAYSRRIRGAMDVTTAHLPPVQMYTPPFFLLSRQTYYESSSYLYDQSVTFTYGMLDLDHITTIARPMLFSKLTSIDLSDSGTVGTASNLCSISYRGHALLIEELANILARGHHLKNFSITFTSRRLRRHLNVCWGKAAPCGYRDLYRNALLGLRKVRGVEKVTFGGVLPPVFCAHLKKHMESLPLKPCDLPLNVRKLIYKYAMAAHNSSSDATT